MDPGEFIEEFITKDNKKIKIRAIDSRDVNNIVEFTNKLIEEDAPILLSEKQDYNSGFSYVYNLINNMAKNKGLSIIAEYNDELIAYADLIKHLGREEHIGELGIIISKDFRNKGLGYELMNILIRIAKEQNCQILTLHVYSHNLAAIRLYEKLGFRKAGVIPKAAFFNNVGYVDNINMYKSI
ncbi:MAG: GNAT family N-acetyltransferase [Candidatus Micrarchaeia archaeon]